MSNKFVVAAIHSHWYSLLFSISAKESHQTALTLYSFEMIRKS